MIRTTTTYITNQLRIALLVLSVLIRVKYTRDKCQALVSNYNGAIIVFIGIINSTNKCFEMRRLYCPSFIVHVRRTHCDHPCRGRHMASSALRPRMKK